MMVVSYDYIAKVRSPNIRRLLQLFNQTGKFKDKVTSHFIFKTEPLTGCTEALAWRSASKQIDLVPT